MSYCVAVLFITSDDNVMFFFLISEHRQSAQCIHEEFAQPSAINSNGRVEGLKQIQSLFVR